MGFWLLEVGDHFIADTTDSVNLCTESGWANHGNRQREPRWSLLFRHLLARRFSRIRIVECERFSV